jgi:hypothetical protein
MNDIDTDAARAAWGGTPYVYPAGVILALCDALDAARAERDDATRLLDEYESGDMADLNAAERRAEAAEARINAALGVMAPYVMVGGLNMSGNWAFLDIRRALTGGTE